MSVLARKILQAYENMGFVSAFVYGHQGVGKTTYALKVLHRIYSDWDVALRRTYFNLDLLIADLNEAFQQGERIPAVLVDDAGISLLKYRWQRESEQWFSKFFNLVRSVAAGFIFTSVEVGDIVKFVRDKIRYRVSIVRLDHRRALARGYEVIMLPSLDHRIRRAFVDRFTVELPDEVRKSYEEKRKNAISGLFSENHIESDVLRRARELREDGYSWTKIADIIHSEFGIKKSWNWFRRKLNKNYTKSLSKTQ